MSATCPACGVAVVPGYVKCPKCGAALPSVRSSAAGGTAVAGGGGGSPVLPFVVGGLVALGIVLFFALRGGGGGAETPADQPETAVSPEAEPTTAPELDPRAALAPSGTAGTAAPDPRAAVGALDRALKKERLWGTVAVSGARVDIRSGLCGDPGMMPVVDANAPALREGGLTHLRCLEQSGAVVFERDL